MLHHLWIGTIAWKLPPNQNWCSVKKTQEKSQWIRHIHNNSLNDFQSSACLQSWTHNEANGDSEQMTCAQTAFVIFSSAFYFTGIFQQKRGILSLSYPAFSYTIHEKSLFATQSKKITILAALKHVPIKIISLRTVSSHLQA